MILTLTSWVQSLCLGLQTLVVCLTWWVLVQIYVSSLFYLSYPLPPCGQIHVQKPAILHLSCFNFLWKAPTPPRFFFVISPWSASPGAIHTIPWQGNLDFPFLPLDWRLSLLLSTPHTPVLIVIAFCCSSVWPLTFFRSLSWGSRAACQPRTASFWRPRGASEDIFKFSYNILCLEIKMGQIDFGN